MPLINTFLLIITQWLELDFENRGQFLDKMECVSECLGKCIRQMSCSCLTEHLTVLWVLSKRVQCAFRGIPLENSQNVTYRSIGGVSQQPQGFRSLQLGQKPTEAGDEPGARGPG